ncbi:hypothetical protein B0H34DRAFT_331980 [Crassisporium funariophilum]|nr:hypothetical protein B0H34DRAFT_331980 [Crassisporium funariophilum]
MNQVTGPCPFLISTWILVNSSRRGVHSAIPTFSVSNSSIKVERPVFAIPPLHVTTKMFYTAATAICTLPPPWEGSKRPTTNTPLVRPPQSRSKTPQSVVTKVI